MIAVLNWLLAHWWVFIWLSIFGVFEGVRDFFLGCAEAIGDLFSIRHRRKLELAKAQAKAARAQARAAGIPADRTLPAAPCRHRNIVGVRDRTDKLVAWLCLGCDTKLPASFSVYEEDL